jgi:heavy metal translocating P-type ATPase
MQFSIQHSLPGRIRVYLPALRLNPALGDLLLAWLKCQEHVDDVRLNPYCYSIVIQYRSGAATPWMEHLGNITPQQLRPAALQDPVKALIPPAASTLGVNSTLRFTTLSLGLSLISVPAGALFNLPLLLWNAAPIFKRAAMVVIRERRLNVDFLDGLSIVFALTLNQLFTAAFIVWLISLGDWIRDRTAAKSKRAIATLLEFESRIAWVVRDHRIIQIPAVEVRTGDTAIVYAGEMIPVDGEIVSGAATVDQKTITGESMPVLRKNGDRVYAGTVVREGKLRLLATRVGRDTTAAQIVSLVESAPVTETRVQNYAEKFADGLVAPWLAVSIGAWALTGNMERLLSMMIIDYGTGIRVAAPTSILAYMTAAARQGILIKGGSQMEKLARADTLIFDKTGTLTRGVPHVVEVLSYDERLFPVQHILEIAAAVETRVKHPVAEAIVTKAQEANLTIPGRSSSKYRVGLGVEAQVNGYYVHLGSNRFLKENGVQTERAASDIRRFEELGCSTLVMAINGDLVGAIPCVDQVRPESREVIRKLHKSGIRNVIMVTGDSATAARNVSRELGIDRVFAETLPADKAEIVKMLQAEGRTVVMVGDGINDSPALAYADVGVAMKNGADVARESADVVLMEDNLWKLAAAVELSHQAMGLVRQNFGIIAVLNTVAVVLAIPSGLVSPAIIAGISNGSAILASVNAFRPLLGRGSKSS